MTFTAQTSDLLKCASLAQRATKSKTTLMALSHLLVEPTEDSVTVTGTDLEVSLACSCAAMVHAPEPFLVPSELFLGILKNSESEVCAIETTKNSVKITIGQAESTISTLDVNEFPKFPEASSEPIEFDSKVLSKALKIAACNTMEGQSNWEDSRIGVNILAKNGKIHITSANLKSMATVEFESMATVDAVVSKKFMDLVALVAGEDDGKTILEINDRTSVARLKNRVVTGKLRDGKFIPWWNFIPESKGMSFSINKEALVSSLKTASMFSEDRFYGVVIDINGSATISTRGALNRHSESIPVEKTGFEVFKFAVCHEGLLSILPKLSGESVVFQITDPRLPIMIQEDNFRYVTATLQNL